MGSSFERDLDKNPANYQNLTPLTYLERAAKVFPAHIAIIHAMCMILEERFAQGTSG